MASNQKKKKLCYEEWRVKEIEDREHVERSPLAFLPISVKRPGPLLIFDFVAYAQREE